MTALALALQALPGVRLVGQVTGTALGEIREGELESRHVVQIPMECLFTLLGAEISGGKGLKPDVPIPRFSSAQDLLDLFLEIMAELQKEVR